MRRHSPAHAALRADAAFMSPVGADPPPQSENPGAGSTGAQFSLAGVSHYTTANGTDTQPEGTSPSRRVGAALVTTAHALTRLRLGDEPAGLVDDAATALRYHLGPAERGFMLMVAAQTAEPDDLEALAGTVIAGTRRGAPVPTFDDVRAEARLWASWASLPERRAYFGAIWNQLPEAEQAGFLESVNRRAAA